MAGLDKKYWRKELRHTDTIYVVGIKRGTNPNWDRGIWRKFRVYYVKDGELGEIFIQGDDYPTVWIPRHKTRSGRWRGGYFEVSSLGENRVFRIAYELGRWLYGDGYRFRAVFLSQDPD